MTNEEAYEYGKRCAIEGKLAEQATIGVKDNQKTFVLKGYYKGYIEKRNKERGSAAV